SFSSKDYTTPGKTCQEGQQTTAVIVQILVSGALDNHCNWAYNIYACAGKHSYRLHIYLKRRFA
ncbi:MAG: hypothetical protein ACPLYD_14285, partial [Anaerolineae bacterium]